MFGMITRPANKIAARYRARSAAAGVFDGRGGAGAGRIGAQLAPVGLDVAQVVRIVENQGLGGSCRGGVASPDVASLALCLQFQGFGATGRQIASFATGSRARVSAAAAPDPARLAGAGRPPHGGAGRQLHPRCAWRRSPANRAARPPCEAMKAQQGSKNRVSPAATNGVGGSGQCRDARFQCLKRLNSRAKSRPAGLKWGRGVSNPAHLWRGKAASLCGGRNRVN
jgi:hypothetical protein